VIPFRQPTRERIKYLRLTPIRSRRAAGLDQAGTGPLRRLVGESGERAAGIISIGLDGFDEASRGGQPIAAKTSLAPGQRSPARLALVDEPAS